MSNKVLVIGSGGIGGFYAALLHKAGWQVSMVARSDHANIRQHGLKVESTLGDLSFTPVQCYQSVEQAAQAGAADWVLIAIKMLPGVNLAELIAPAVGENTKIALIANGLGIEQDLSQRFPSHAFISIVAFVATTRITAGHIKHEAYGRLILGDYHQNAAAACQTLADSFNQAGVEAAISVNVQKDRWKKSIWNASFNPLSVATNGADTGKLLGTPEAEQLVRNLMAEVIAVAAADGFTLSADLIDKNLATTRAMPPYHTSMAVDYLNGHAIELEAILGNIVRIAERKKLSVPHLNTLYQTLLLRQ